MGSRLVLLITGDMTISLNVCRAVPDVMDLFTIVINIGQNMTIFALINSVGRGLLEGNILI